MARRSKKVKENAVEKHLSLSEVDGVGYTPTYKRMMEQAVRKEEIDLCRDMTEIGEDITFVIFYEKGSGLSDVIIKGTVVKKYPHIFLLSDGRSYSWVQYVIGNAKVHDNLKSLIGFMKRIDFYETHHDADYSTYWRRNVKRIKERTKKTLSSKFTPEELKALGKIIKV